MSARPTTDQETLTLATSMLAERLPADWAVAFTRRGRGDAQLNLRTRDAQTAFRLQVRMRVDGRVIDDLRTDDDNVVLVTPFVSPTFQDRLRREGINYLDVTGNVRISSAAPAMFVSDRGADTDPWRGPGRPTKSLKGCPATTVVRTLLDTNRKWRIRDLIATADASTGTTYRVLDLLTDEGLARRDDNGEIAVTNWTELLRRWSAEYSYLDSNRITRWIAPRGFPDLLRQLRESKAPYVLTGTKAAEQWTEYAPARTVWLYTPNPERSAPTWGLRPAEAGVNVLVAEPFCDALMRGAVVREDGLRVARTAQVAADLLTGPGRAPAEGEELLRWMERNERAWRT